MGRIDFQFYREEGCHTAHGKTLQQDRDEETGAGGEGDSIVCHVTVTAGEVGKSFLDLLWAVQGIDANAVEGTGLERFADALFRAGVEFGRQNPID